MCNWYMSHRHFVGNPLGGNGCGPRQLKMGHAVGPAEHRQWKHRKDKVNTISLITAIFWKLFPPKLLIIVLLWALSISRSSELFIMLLSQSQNMQLKSSGDTSWRRNSRPLNGTSHLMGFEERKLYASSSSSQRHHISRRQKAAYRTLLLIFFPLVWYKLYSPSPLTCLLFYALQDESGVESFVMI